MAYDTAVRIGSGGMGEVYKAWDPELERFVALKFLRHDDPELVERLFREARAQARVDHPGICEVYEVGEDDGRPYIAMQYVEGESVDRRLSRLGPIRESFARSIAWEVAEGLEHAHEQKIIHRDIKPSNLIICSDGRV